MTELTRAEFLKLAAGAGAALTVAVAAPAAHAAETMRTRPIPKTSEPLPVVGLGTWRVFNIGNEPEERAPRQEIIEILFETGGRVIDTAPSYGNSERVVGELLDELGLVDLPFLATKVSERGREMGIEQMNRSFELLHKRPLDLMQIHNLRDWRTHLATLRAWKEEGLIRYYGITHYTTDAIDELAAIVAAEELDFLQCAYSIAVPDAGERLLPLCGDRGVATLINRPFERGSTFSRVKGHALPGWAAEFDCNSWAQFFLKFVLGDPAVTCVIPGTSKPKHMRDNAGAGMGLLPEPDQRTAMLDFFKNL